MWPMSFSKVERIFWCNFHLNLTDNSCEIWSVLTGKYYFICSGGIGKIQKKIKTIENIRSDTIFKMFKRKVPFLNRSICVKKYSKNFR